MGKINLKFDLATRTPEKPTIILANKNGRKIDQIQARNIIIKESMMNPSEISFNVNKFENSTENRLWNKIVNFRLVWCKEWNTLFEISVETDESIKTVKHVSGVQLGQAELSKIKLFNIEINTEKDIERDDYEITILFDENNPKGSLLDRIMEKTPHYTIAHVDASIAKIQRTFSFDDISVHDAFQEISEEVGCIFVYNSFYDENGKIIRSISVYDLQQNCKDCGYRGEFIGKCPKCQSQNITEGYGKDTTIFITSDELANNLRFTTDTKNVNNCFKLETGDDLMTATVRNCNPNGSDYIWYISDEMKGIMSDELVSKLNQYDGLYSYYQKEHPISIDNDLLSKYNSIVSKYKSYDKNLEQILVPIIGYPNLMTAYYNTIDLAVYLQSTLMPDAKLSDTTAEEQSRLLTSENLSPVAADNTKNMTISTANNAVLAMAKSIIDSRYQTKINMSTFSDYEWTGNFIITNYSDEEDTATSSTVTIFITNDYEDYVKQRLQKLLNKEAIDLSISGLFEKEYDDFCNELKKYCLDSLNSFYNICQSCIDILIEQGIADKDTWADKNPSLYDDLYLPYRNKLDAIQAEISVRDDEINTITGIKNDGEIISYGLQDYIVKSKEQIQNILNFENYLGEELWLEFCTYRREDKYSNSNYISDGLNNSELFEKALEFLETANKEIYKSSTQQHSISSNLKNIFAIEKFKPLYDYFEVGNWLRVQIDDKVYKLRLLEYEIDYDSLGNLSTVDFSDVLKIVDGISDAKSLFEKAATMSTSYDSVQKQAEQGVKSNNVVSAWTNKGLDVTKTKILSGADGQTQTWDEHGILLRKYNPITDTYDDEQTRFLNGSMFITNDNWKTVKTAIGGYYYYDLITGELKYTYGVNAETLIGNLILGENLGIYANDGSLTFNDEGFKVFNNNNSFIINPNAEKLILLSNKNEDIFYVKEDGELYIKGDGTDLDISENEEMSKKVGNEEVIDKINNSPEEVSIQADKIKLEGLVTANSNFKILQDGSIESKNAKFSGDVTGSGGEFTKSFKVKVPISRNVGFDTPPTFNIESDGDGTIIGTEETEGITTFYPSYILLNSDNSIKIYADNSLSLRTAKYISLDAQGNSIGLSGNVSVSGSFNVGGTKSRIVDTKNYNTRKLYCYETASPYFGDIGHGIIGNDGLCYIDIDCIFAETIDTIQNYNVFLQSYSDKQVYVYQKEYDFFVVKGTPNTEFDWEIKAKQVDYKMERLDEHVCSDIDLDIDYVEQAENYLKTYERELISDEQH